MKFNRRFENGYDLPDKRYKEWLRLHHPDEWSYEYSGTIVQELEFS